MRVRGQKRKQEPTIALINVVFLMLVFFLITGTVATPLSKDVSLIKTENLDPAAPPDGLVILPDGSLVAGGVRFQDFESYFNSIDPEERQIVRLIPDQDTPAHILLRIAANSKTAGAEIVRVVTERSLQ